jgi:hypothetical protein
MEYKEIVVVTGDPGLFQLVSSKNDGAIVRTLDGLSTKFVPSRLHQFTPLESIEVFTTGENVSLMEVFRTMLTKESETAVISPNQGAAEIKAYFDKVYPELDESRVYMSDMKKMLKWFPLLREHGLITEAAAEEQEPAAEAPAGAPAAETEAAVPEAAVPEAEAAKPAPKKKAAAKAAPKTEGTAKAAPKKAAGKSGSEKKD